jgi:NTE family protein
MYQKKLTFIQKALSIILFCSILVNLPAAIETRQLRIGSSYIQVTQYGFTEGQLQSKPKIALALSGGGARGVAHIPIIEAIELAGIPVDMVVGTSMGSLIGGLYAAGYSPGDMRRLIAANDLLTLFMVEPIKRPQPIPKPMRQSRDNVFSLTFDSKGLGNTSGLLGDQRILVFLHDLLSRVAGITDFDKLAIPFRCIGTDIITGERVVFSQGSLVSAIRGSIAIPVVFTPYPIEGRFIVDGGLVDNLPIQLAREMGADIVIAVDVNSSDYDVTIEELSSITAMLSQVLAIVTKNTVSGQLADADLLINPNLSDYGILDFFNIKEIYSVGEQTAQDYKTRLDSMAQEISTLRSLYVRDPNRYGVYFSLPDVYVRSISHAREIGSSHVTDSFDLGLFKQFVGFPLDTKRKQELNKLFEDIRNQGVYATVSYGLNQVVNGNAGESFANLEIATRAFPKKPATIGLGFFGSSTITFNPGPSAVGFDFIPDFSLSFTVDRIPGSIFGLEARISLDDALYVDLGINFPEGNGFTPALNIRYSVGGLHPENIRVSTKEVKEVDRLLSMKLSGSYSFEKKGLVSTSFAMDALAYGGDHVDDGIPGSSWITVIPLIQIEAVWADLAFGFFPREGIHADLKSEFGWTSYGNIQKIEARIRQAFALGAYDTVSYDFHVGYNRTKFPQKKYYLDYGGARGMGGYGPHSFVEDMVLGRILYLHALEKTSLPLYLQLGMMVGSRSSTINETISSGGSFIHDSPPFSGLKPLEAGFSLSLGMSSTVGDLLFSVAFGTTGRFAISVEFL